MKLHLFTLSAQRGHRPSMLRLGIMYYWGRGIEPNASKALHWLRLAADKGSRAACLNYANVCYAYATFIKEKESLMNEQAWKYYSKAARKDGRYIISISVLCAMKVNFVLIKREGITLKLVCCSSLKPFLVAMQNQLCICGIF